MTANVRVITGKAAIYQRNYRRARDRALTRLREAHVEEYRAYLVEEKLKDEENGRTWIVDDSSSGIPVRTYSYKDTFESGATGDVSPTQGNNGGEA